MGRYKSPEAQKNFYKYQQEYNKQHYARIVLEVPKDTKKYIQEYAKANGKSVTKLILDLLGDNKII